MQAVASLHEATATCSGASARADRTMASACCRRLSARKSHFSFSPSVLRWRISSRETSPHARNVRCATTASDNLSQTASLLLNFWSDFWSERFCHSVKSCSCSRTRRVLTTSALHEIMVRRSIAQSSSAAQDTSMTCSSRRLACSPETVACRHAVSKACQTVCSACCRRSWEHRVQRRISRFRFASPYQSFSADCASNESLALATSSTVVYINCLLRSFSSL
mmetsp:Transcript_81086/g.262616  ORF Transcript_81086/g.262616 Transcript_81086/m.262616 type:complete len:222 (+) Transcript_81086:209-874(+)